MHIVHYPTTATGEALPDAVAAVFGVLFTASDCEALEDGPAQTDCLAERQPSDDFFTAMGVFGAADARLEFTEEATDIPI